MLAVLKSSYDFQHDFYLFIFFFYVVYAQIYMDGIQFKVS